MEPQTLINIAFSLAGAMGGWILNRLWSDMDKVESQISETDRRLSEVRELVAGQYVKRAELDRHMVRLFEKLDSMDRKLDSKADK